MKLRLFKKLHYSLKLVYFIANNLGISLSSCMVLRILTAPLTKHVSIPHLLSLKWKEEIENEVQMGEALHHFFL